MWYRLSYKYYEEDLPRSLRIHNKIYSLFANRESNVDELEKLVRQHCEEAIQIFLKYLEENIENK
jgi:DNA-binding GntR family transcriptional regulator